MKGATDGGLVIPHRDNGKQFPGWYKEDRSENYNAETCRKYVFGGHVGDYMKKLEEDKPEKYKTQFSQYIAKGITADDLEELYAKVHSAIRANPEGLPKKEADKAQTSKFVKTPKLSRATKRDHVLNKILSLRRKAA